MPARDTHKSLLHQAALYYHTLRHLRPIQVRYRIYYALRARWRRLRGFRFEIPTEAPTAAALKLLPAPPPPQSWLGPRRFRFLNLEKQFDDEIDWDFSGHGKLWTYNLNYFDFLRQPQMNPETGLRLMRELTAHLPQAQNALEPYPLSLRIGNWVKFIALQGIRDRALDRSLYAQYLALWDRLEYHLLANHLLENALGLLHGVYYFQDESGYRKVSRLLAMQLDEQVLADGGHYERSPMYHQILLAGVLDGLNLLRHNPWQSNGLLRLLEEKASAMLGWLQRMTLPNGRIPLFNDCAEGIALATSTLLDYGRRLGVEAAGTVLGESGYRRFDGENHVLIADVGEIGPDYNPGHAHCDTLSFVMDVGGKPWLIDTGTSTYETGQRRQAERTTAAHNTVQLGELEQSEVWGGFRVGRRARPTLFQDTPNLLEAEHDGYLRQGCRHRRIFRIKPEGIVLEDVVEGGTNLSARAYFHFAPEVTLKLEADSAVTDLGTMEFSGHQHIEQSTYRCAREFNRTQVAPMLTVRFSSGLRTKIHPRT